RHRSRMPLSSHSYPPRSPRLNTSSPSGLPQTSADAVLVTASRLALQVAVLWSVANATNFNSSMWATYADKASSQSECQITSTTCAYEIPLDCTALSGVRLNLVPHHRPTKRVHKTEN